MDDTHDTTNLQRSQKDFVHLHLHTEYSLLDSTIRLKDLFKQAKEIQGKMTNMKEELADAEYEGKSGGGLVTVVITGAGHMKSVSIDKSLFNSDEKEMLEDLIIAAFNAAKAKLEAASEDA